MNRRGTIGSVIRIISIFVAGSLLSACGTTKATTDATVAQINVTSDFISSTTPGAFFTQDGLLKAGQKLRFFVIANEENLAGDMARGSGEYLSAAGTLLGVSPDRAPGFLERSQARYLRASAAPARHQSMVQALQAAAQRSREPQAFAEHSQVRHR